MKVAATRAELLKIQHKSIQVVAEGIGLENYLIRNVAAHRNFQCNAKFFLDKHFAVTHSLNFYQDELDPAEHTKECLWRGKKSRTSKIYKKATKAFSFIRFFNCFFVFSFEAEIDAF